MKNLQLLVLLFVNAYSFSQVGIGTTTPNASAVLDLTSTSKGLLPPRMTSVQMNAIPSPAEALTVYCANCTPKGPYYFDGTTWVASGSAAAATVSVVCTGFTGSYCTATLSGTTYVVTVTNNDFSAKQVTPTTADLTLSGLTGVTVASVSPNTVQTINAGASLVITYTLSGTPATAGTLTGSFAKQGLTCSSTVAVVAAKAVTAASSSPALCINTALSAITHTTSGAATGIGTATGLPAGVTAAWASNTITISGTPTASGTFNYTIPVNGCGGTVNATGTITVNPALVAGAASATPTVPINVLMTNVTHSTTNVTSIGTPTGLPPGVTAAWAANTITISGTPTASGTFAYTIPLVGTCGNANATGTVTVANLTGDALTASALSTNLTAFNNAAAGAVVQITATEYANLKAISTTSIIHASDAQMALTAMGGSNGANYVTSYNSVIPAGAKFVGFTIKMAVTDVVQLWNCAGSGGVGTQATRRYSTPSSVAGGSQSYFVIKTPTAESAGYMALNHTSASAAIATNNTVNTNGTLAYSYPPATSPVTMGSNYSSFTTFFALIQILNRTN